MAKRKLIKEEREIKGNRKDKRRKRKSDEKGTGNIYARLGFEG